MQKNVEMVLKISQATAILILQDMVEKELLIKGGSSKQERCRIKVRPHKEVIELSQGGMAERSCRPAFSLPEQEQQILILRFVAAMADGEIGGLVRMYRSAIQRHRTKTLNELRQRLEDNGVVSNKL